MDTKTMNLACEDLWRDGRLRDDLLVVDVRTPAEFRELHIPGSTNVPLGDLRRRLPEIRELAGGRPLALVCRTGRRAESARGDMLADACAGVEVLGGGLVSWLADELPVNRGAAAMSIERQVRIGAGALVVLGVALGFWVHTGFLALAAFVGAGLVFAGVTDTCGMAMVLARMPWNRAGAACASLPAPSGASGSEV